jgi:hypothetical protein
MSAEQRALLGLLEKLGRPATSEELAIKTGENAQCGRSPPGALRTRGYVGRRYMEHSTRLHWYIVKRPEAT